jgi:hypothetical protein
VPNPPFVERVDVSLVVTLPSAAGVPWAMDERRHPRRFTVGAAICGFCLPVAISAPTAEATTEIPGPQSHRVRALASFGGAIGGVGGYEGYGVGFLCRTGVEWRLSPGGKRHALVVAAEAGRFAAWGIDTPFLFQGGQLDLAAFRAAWRFYPWRGHGLYLDGGSGLVVARDRVALVLPDREVRATDVRVGVPVEFGTGWLVGEKLDVSLRYTQVVFTARAPASFGFMQLALGVRL